MEWILMYATYGILEIVGITLLVQMFRSWRAAIRESKESK